MSRTFCNYLIFSNGLDLHPLTGYSAHADQNMLVNWVKSMPAPPGEIRLVHGESSARHALARALGV
jgi:metallo-beta-lactamase family protein